MCVFTKTFLFAENGSTWDSKSRLSLERQRNNHDNLLFIFETEKENKQKLFSNNIVTGDKETAETEFEES